MIECKKSSLAKDESITKVTIMTCYFRHLNEIFQKAGIEITKENKQKADKIIHSIVGTKKKGCSETWLELKKQIAVDPDSFVLKLKEEWNK